MMKNKTGKNNRPFLFADNSVGMRVDKKILYFMWNLSAILLSSMGLCALCLYFAIGRYDRFYIFLGYFRTTEIFLLNWIPILMLQLILYAVFNRQWLAFTVTSAITLMMSYGNYYKLIFRSDPFTFDDMSSIMAGLAVAGEYEVRVDGRIMFSMIVVILSVIVLMMFAKAGLRQWQRVMLITVVISVSGLLWRNVYTDGNRYYENSYRNYPQITRDRRDNFVANGFFYPFLYSITLNSNIAPDGYDENAAEAKYDEYHNVDIPHTKKPNIMVIQLESFCDLEAAGLSGIAPDVYQPLRQLQAEGYSGMLLPSVIGGGTVNTERCVLTGSFQQQDYYKPAYSYVRYLNAQGYQTTSSHPNVPSFYTRNSVNSFLGFHEFYHLDNYFGPITNGDWRCDKTYLPEIFRMFRKMAREGDQPVFSFNVSLQGHSPYNAESYDRENNLWNAEGVSDSTRYQINNYLSLIRETQEILLSEIEHLRVDEQPMIVLFYGDHKPWFGDQAYEELGLHITMETQKGMEDYLSTPYVIWANPAAKQMLEVTMSGDAPTVSPGYLMNVLFDELSWNGPAFMQYTREVMAHIPVICNRGGYIVDGVYTQALNAQWNTSLKEYQNLLYYIHYRPELAG